MLRKMFAITTAVAAGLLIVGVAWAGTDDSTSTSLETSSTSPGPSIASVGTPDSTSTSLGDTTSTTQDDTTSTSQDDSTSTSRDDDDDSTTSTSVASTTSTSSGTSTSTSFDDSDIAPPDGVSTYAILGVGSVTIEVRNGSLHLLGVSAPGWNHEIDKAEFDRIEIELHAGDAEAEFEARIHHGGIEVNSKVESD